MFTRFVECARGGVAPIFAIALLPMLAATGAAVDYSQAYQLRTSVQTALDAAALAANRKVGVLNADGIKAEAEKFYLANIGDKIANPPPFSMNLDGGAVILTTELHVPTHFLGVIGFDELVFDITSKTMAGAATYEVALVLDNSGSMQGSKISSLKTAAKNLVQILFDVNASNPKPDPVKIGLVPFAASVNVGTQYAGASWMDLYGKSPIHYEDFEDTSKTRWALFDDMKYTSWGGCVEARPYPYDVNDAAPTGSNPSTLFVPMFAPDEADKGGFDNDYLTDNGGSCSSVGSTGYTTSSQQAAQARLCKYKNVKPSGGSGPNANCTTQALQTLTTSKSTIDSEIGSMKAGGMTNIHSGIMWGWRLLSPTAPFTEGRSYDEKDNRKIMVVMTDGANTYTSNSTFNKSMYGAFGYISHGHLGTTSTNNDTVVSKMDERTLEACSAVKATGKVTIYTVAFQVTDKNTLQMLQDCASEAGMAFQSSNSSELIATFNQIATEISLLRIAE